MWTLAETPHFYTSHINLEKYNATKISTHDKQEPKWGVLVLCEFKIILDRAIEAIFCNSIVFKFFLLAMVFLKIYEYIQKAFFLKHLDLTEPN